jgi:hypothetical protein
MALERRPAILLGVLVVVSAGSAYLYWPRTATVSVPQTIARTADGRPASGRPGAPDVHLEALDRARPGPGDAERNLFRFASRPIAHTPAPAPVMPPPDLPPPGPPPPPPVPPIPLRFIGLVEGGAGKLAILSDGRGAPMYGREGEVVLGQYKIERIGVESIELSYLDGRGRQTIRLSGS